MSDLHPVATDIAPRAFRVFGRTGPSVSDEQVRSTCQRMETLYRQSRYLDAYTLGRDVFGSEIRRWTPLPARLEAVHLSRELGGDQLSEVLTHGLWRDAPEHPEVILLKVNQRMCRRPLARVWLEIRNRELPTDNPELQSRWLALKGSVLTEMRDFDRGFELLHHALRLSPDRPRSHLAIARAYQAKDELAKAIGFCRDAIEVGPVYAPALQYLGFLLLQDNKADEAIRWLGQSVETTQSGASRLQLASIYVQREHYHSARKLIQDIDRYFPLADPLRSGRCKRGSVDSSLCNLRSELAYHRGHYESAARLAQKSNSAFHDSVANSLIKSQGQGKFVKLNVPFVLQKNVTCAPATLSMLMGYWGNEVDHDEVVDEICYDGTAPVKQRRWAEENGMVAKEFRVNETVISELIDAKIPFAVSSTEPGNGHIQVVCGYDSRRGLMLIQDPGHWHVRQAIVSKFLDRYQAFGPRGLVLVPEEKASLLNSIDLPDVECFDRQYAVSFALQNHDRAFAARIVQEMLVSQRDHWLTHWVEMDLARYDANCPQQLEAVQKLRTMFPDDQTLLLWECNLIAHTDQTGGVIESLRGRIRKGEAGAELRLRLMHLLETKHDQSERKYLLRWVLKNAPTNPTGLAAESARLWESKRHDDAMEMARLAAMSGERDEAHSRHYMDLGKRLGKHEEVLKVLKERFRLHGHASGQPGMTYAYALRETSQPELAAAVIREAIASRPEDGKLLCEAATVLGSLESPKVGFELLENTTCPLPEVGELQTRAVLSSLSGRPDQALEAYRRIQTLQPLNLSVIDRISELMTAVSGIDPAIEFLTELTEHFPHCRGLLCTKSQLLQQAARYEEALVAIDQMLGAHHDDPWAWRQRALVCADAGWYRQGLVDAQRGLECEQSCYSHGILGDMLMRNDRCQEAKLQFRKALEDDCDYPSSFHAWMCLCECEEESKSVLDFYHRQLIVQHSAGPGMSAFYAHGKGLLDESAMSTRLQQFCEARPDVFECYHLLARHFLRCSMHDHAEAVLVDVQQKFAWETEYWRSRGQLDQYLGRPEQAVASMQRAHKIAPFDSEVACGLAEAYRACGQDGKAIKVLRDALAGNPGDATLMMALGGALSGAADDEGGAADDEHEAYSLIRQAAALSPYSSEIWDELQRRSRQLGCESDAVVLAEQLVEHRPADAVAHLRLAETLHREEDWERSMQAIEIATGIDPRCVDVHGLRAYRLQQRGHTEEAIQACAPTGIDPSDLHGLTQYAARLMYANGQIEEACVKLRQTMARDPTDLSAWCRIADWSEECGDFLLYDEAARELVSRAPHVAMSHGYYSTTLIRNGDAELAKQHLSEAIRIDPKYDFAVYETIRLQIEAKRFAEATEFLDEISPRVDAECLAIATARLDLAKGDVDKLIDDLNHLPKAISASRICAAAFDGVRALDNPEVASALAAAVRLPNASSAVGHAWALVFCAKESFEVAIDDFIGLPSGNARDEAAFTVVPMLCKRGEDLDDPGRLKHLCKQGRKLTKRLRLVYRESAELWSELLWMLIGLEEFRVAKRVAEDYRNVADPSPSALVPAALAALYANRPRLAEAICHAVADCQDPTMTADLRLLRAVCLVDLGSTQQIAQENASIDKYQLSGAFLQMARLIDFGLQCVEDANTPAFEGYWFKHYVMECDDNLIDQRVYQLFLSRIAEAKGNRRLARKLRRGKYKRPSPLLSKY